ncbi:hypothetical protein F2Q70_00039846 [Brassica cretica]|uniref:FBD domain-containing protein n=1 Tax=Brassica cretica TaxID=69181 RepID=A0A8S9K8B2_BRACR|nr:hypothetical protein F2Q70_00039846 [Brassica cretica]
MLWYYNTTWLVDDTDVVDSGSCLVIDTPALIKFDVTDYSRHSWSIGNMPCLEEAYISVDCLSLFDKIITASSAILSLVLTFEDEMLVRCRTLRFSRLFRLSVAPSRSNCLEPLLLLLGNTPKLEELEFASEPEDIPLSWSQPSSIPECLSSQDAIIGKLKDIPRVSTSSQFLVN